MRRAAGALVFVGAAAYAWWATGLRSFRAPAYVAVGVPVLLVVAGTTAASFARRRDAVAPAAVHRSWRWHAAAPWAMLALAACGLEAWGLALGGRSRTLPTASDAIDHLLRWHGSRFVLFVAWLAVGGLFLVAGRRPDAA